MRRQTPVATLLYSHMFPEDTTSNFNLYLQKNLIPEIRVETATFYGSLDSIEARYPGLNYCHGPHRMRLGRFPHHARLFKAIDELGITNQEVADLARWEGTLWARQRFERDEGYSVIDSTGDSILPWVDRRQERKAAETGIRVRVERAVKITQDPMLDSPSHDGSHMPRIEDFIEDHGRMDEDAREEEANDDDDDDDDDGNEQIGHENAVDLEETLTHGHSTVSHNLERRIMAAFAARQQGSTMDIHPDLEAYLKELVENGHLLAASRPTDGPLSEVDPSVALLNVNSTLGQSAA